MMKIEKAPENKETGFLIRNQIDIQFPTFTKNLKKILKIPCPQGREGSSPSSGTI